jgi:hypothetical protein
MKDPTSIADTEAALPLIKVVGVSASGKSTLVKALRQRGYRARPVSQEHSNVADLWQQFEEPTYLIYLDVDLATQQQRRPDVSWDKQWLLEEQARLRHAHGYANLKIDTSGLSADTVRTITLTFLKNERVRHAEQPLPPLKATGSALSPTPNPVEEVAEPPEPRTAKQRRKRKRAKQTEKKR